MTIENTVSSEFDPRSSLVKRVFDCRLPGVIYDIEWFMKAINVLSQQLTACGNLFVCLTWFFTSHQQSFSYAGTGLPGLNQYLARINVSCTRTTTQWRQWGLNPRPSVSSQAPYHWAIALPMWKSCLKHEWCPENCILQFSGHHSYFSRDFKMMLHVAPWHSKAQTPYRALGHTCISATLI